MELGTLLLFIAALSLGGAVSWFTVREKMRGAVESERMLRQQEGAAHASERSTLEERVRATNIALQAKEGELAAALSGVEAYRQTQLTLERERAQLTEQLRAQGERMGELRAVEERFQQTFRALASEALSQNNSSFLQLAQSALTQFQEGAKGDLEKRQIAIDELVKPVRQALEKVDQKMQVMEQARSTAFATLTQELQSLQKQHQALGSETANLVKALRTPNVRGRWGEIQLKRVVEIAGMLEYCDFVTQESVGAENQRFRPDLVVRLPNQKQIVVDSKAPLQGYLEALEASDDTVRVAKLREHARQIKDHIVLLSQKSYWSQFKTTPEFVVLFLPGETFFSAALEQDPGLIEYGVNQKVILATPTTLIALLKAVAYGWQQERLTEQAQEISTLGKSLFDRMAVFAEHFAKLRAAIQRSVETYNQSSAALESRVLPAIRKFRELGISSDKEVLEATPVDIATRELDLPPPPQQQ